MHRLTIIGQLCGYTPKQVRPVARYGESYNEGAMKTLRRVKAETPEELAKVIDDFEADGEPRILERNGKEIAAVVSVTDARPAERKRKSPEVIREALSHGGSWADVDAEKLKRLLRKAREEGSRPADRPA
jgi:hypothetical protein